MKVSSSTTLDLTAALVPFLSFAGMVSQGIDPEVLLRAAIEKEEVDGDLAAAIEQYEQVLSESGSRRALAATALIRLGGCYEKLGKEEARKVFERVVAEYGDQAEQAQIARLKLTAMAREQKRAGPTLRKVWDSYSTNGYFTSGAISQDGRYAVYVDWSSGELGVHDFITRTNRQITQKPADHTGWYYCEVPAISPDGKRVAYIFPVRSQSALELRVIDTDGSNTKTLLREESTSSAGGFRPYSWSPDGKEILNAHGDGKSAWLELVNADDGSVRVLKKLRSEQSQKWRFSNPGFSPDGRYVAYSDIRENAVSQNRDVFMIDVETGQESQITEHSSDDEFVGWTPGGKSILFTSNRTDESSLWMIQVEEGQPQGLSVFLHAPLERQINLTLDGSLYFTTWNDEINVYLAELDGTEIVGNPGLVNSNGVNSSIMCDWSPDGKYLAYRAGFLRSPDRPYVILSLETGQADRKSLFQPLIGSPFSSRQS